MLSIIYGTLLGSFARPSEICLQGWRASVENRESVCIIGPCIAECGLHFISRKLFKGASFLRLARKANFVQLHMGNIAREDALYYVSAVQAIHAVGSHHSCLGAQNPAGL